MLLVYQLKVGLCLIAFYLVWKLLLSRETLHRFNRVLLLSVTLLAFALPFVKLTLEQASPVAEGQIDIEGLFAIAEVVSEAPESEPFLLGRLLYIIYKVGLGAMMLWSGWTLLMLYRTLRQGNKEHLKGGIVMHVMSSDLAPFSYFRHIVISEQDLADAGQEIITHEEAHIRLGHSWDVLLMDVALLFQWWNPAAWLLRRELKQVHEYEADEAVLVRGVDAQQYQLLLIRKSVGDQLFSMANNFNYQSLKKRIRMMTRKRSSRWQQLRALTVVPVAALALVAFAQPEVKDIEEQVSASIDAPDPVSVSSLADTPLTFEAEGVSTPEVVGAFEPEATPSTVTTPSETPAEVSVPTSADTPRSSEAVGVFEPAEMSASAPADTTQRTFDVVEQMPVFPGGDTELMKFLRENIRYPKDAMDAQKQGRVVVTFVVDAEGQVVEPRVVKKVFPSIDQEALRIIGLMPKWIPGKQSGKAVRVKYTIPITFKLQGEKEKAIYFIEDIQSMQANPLILIDDNEATKADIEALDSKNIESVTVLRGVAGERVYGEKGKKGVVIVKMKTSTQNNQ